MMLCPEGSEGVTYALLSTMPNLAGTVAQDIASYLTLYFNVGNEALQAQDFNGMLKLTVLTSFLQVVPLVLLHILPDSKVRSIFFPPVL